MLEEVLARYTPAQKYEISEFFRVLAMRTRKSKRISESRKENILKSWEKYDADVVIDSMQAYGKMNLTAAYNEKYVGGIIRNKQKSKEMSVVGRGTGNNNTNKDSNGISKEGEKLRIGKVRDKELQCDF